MQANFRAVVMQLRYACRRWSLLPKGGDPNGIRTRVTAVKGRCPRPLDDRVGERQISGRGQTLQAAFRAGDADNPVCAPILAGRIACVTVKPRARYRRAACQDMLEIFSIKAAERAAASRCG